MRSNWVGDASPGALRSDYGAALAIKAGVTITAWACPELQISRPTTDLETSKQVSPCGMAHAGMRRFPSQRKP